MTNQSSSRNASCGSRPVNGSGRNMGCNGRSINDSDRNTGCADRSMSAPDRSSGCADRSMSAPGRNSGCASRPMNGVNRNMINTCRQTPSRGSRPSTDMRPISSDKACGCKQDSVSRSQCQDKDPVTCIRTTDFPVGMAYVPMQKWGKLYEPSRGLSQGTLFPELDKPFLGRRAAQ